MEAICIVDYEFQEKEHKKTKVPLKFYECYGVWFAGKLKNMVTEIARTRFATDLRGRMHVFIEPERVEKEKPVLSDGIHEVSVYGHSCLLYKWTAQGYHRGLVVLKDDLQANRMSEVYYESKTWSWQLSDSSKSKLPEGYKK
ncbi:MAG: hypothetical protein ACOYL3_23270 [Desulfuromonadaceae bacterium]